MFNTLQIVWTRVPPILIGRNCVAAGMAGSSILVVDRDINVDVDPSGTAEILDLNRTLMQWMFVDSVNQVRANHGGTMIWQSSSSFHMVVAG